MTHVTIVIPAHNRPELLAEAVASAVAVAHRPLEILIVDDGSSDSTPQVARRLCMEPREDGLSTRLIEQPNQGAPVARNTGWQAARGNAVLFLDSDDTLLPEGVGALAAALEARPQAAYAVAQVLETDRNGSSLGKTPIGRPPSSDPVSLMAYDWHTMGALYRKGTIADAGGWDPGIRGADDWIFQARIKLTGAKAIYVPAVIGHWREHEGDRVGATRFRASYTLDVVRAAHSIALSAYQKQQLNPPLKQRLWLRALRHIWELGAHGAWEQRETACKLLVKFPELTLPQRGLCLTLLKIKPLDPLLFRLLCR
jgi:glycosyltransferase involved in cell wall biosynthesis